MEIKKSLRTLKHLFRSPNCINCTQPLDDIIFDIEEGKVVCPTCRFKHNPINLYSDGEIIDLAEILIPNEHEVFLSKLGFKKKAIKKSSKVALIFLLLIMAVGALVSASIMDIGFILKIIVALVFIAATVGQIMKYYKDEEKTKWYKEKTTSP